MTLTIVYIALLTLISAFFSFAETGLTAASRSKIHQKKIEGSRRAEMVSELRDKKKEQLIGAILLGNNAINILASAIATSFFIVIFGQEGVIYATFVMTLVVLIFAEVLPKTYALRHAEKVALFVAPFMMFIIKIFWPITYTVQVVVNFLLRIMRMGADPEEEKNMDALRGAIELHHDEGIVVKDDRDMLGGVLDLNEINVRDVMIHRKTMETLDIGEPIAQMMDKIIQSSHTRIPVWEQDPDNIIGIAHAKLVFRSYKAAQDEGMAFTAENLRSLLMDPWFVPESTSLREQLHAFRQKRSHFALVVDEYGDLLGMITLEDIIEEIVGQIDDEHDVKRQTIRASREGDYIIRGDVSIRDVNRELDWNLPDDTDVATMAGLVIKEAQIIPEVKQVFHFHGYRFEIVQKNRHQIMLMKVRPLTEMQGAGQDQ